MLRAASQKKPSMLHIVAMQFHFRSGGDTPHHAKRGMAKSGNSSVRQATLLRQIEHSREH